MTYLSELKYERVFSETLPSRPPHVPIKEPLIDLYLDWVNNYLTIEQMAKHYALRESELGHLINIGRGLFEAQQKDNKNG